MSLNLWLIRHGQTTVNAGQWSNKPAETCLTDLGKEQAMAAAMQIPRQPDLIITSPLARAKETAGFILQRWPNAPSKIWPIQELIYLSPAKMETLEPAKRKRLVEWYWQNNNPSYCDGSDAESFADFLKRIEQFHTELSLVDGFIVVVGHGQFFKAYELCREYGFTPSPEWMERYRQTEVSDPIKNGEIIKIEQI